MKYKGIVKFTYIQVIEVEAETQERAEEIIWEKFDRSCGVEDAVELYDIWEVDNETIALEHERGRNKLAAAAPELLAALQGLLDEADLNEVNEETAPKIDAARAAIARAVEGVK